MKKTSLLKCRGIDEKTGFFRYGYFSEYSSEYGVGAYICDADRDYPVRLNTVGRFIGKKDNDDSDVYEGDISLDSNGDEFATVEWDNDTASFRIVQGDCSFSAEHAYEFSIVGNIHQNPDFLSDGALSEHELAQIIQRAPIHTVRIPACENHYGLFAVDVRLRWACPICGNARGKIVKGLSYDGALSMSVDAWTNPCGHVDKYDEVRNEAAHNGLNLALKTVKEVQNG